MKFARSTPTPIVLPSHTDLKWLGNACRRWGKAIAKDGHRHIGGLADELGAFLLVLDAAIKNGDTQVAADALENVSATRKELHKPMKHLMALKALSRVLEDVDGDVLRPTGRRACQTRVAARYASRVDPSLVRFWKQRIKRYGPFDDDEMYFAALEAAVDWFVEDNKKSGYKKYPYAADEVLEIVEPLAEKVTPQLLALAKQWGDRNR
jgi:hypothetical protein|tara:strand:+ start:2383 stop:3006 length:624 start_codon:yes stop_codon:yes gene_type:complete